jgi:cystathionine beta-lyase
MSSPFDDLPLAELRARRSVKWTAYPPDVLPAWIAEMDVRIDPEIRATLLAAIERDDLGYADPRPLASAFVGFVRAWFDWTVDPARVLAAPDVLVALGGVLGVLTDPGAKIVINSPVYPPFYRVIAEVGRVVENVPLLHDAETGGWTLDFAGLERAFAGGAQAYVLCSPHNPLGRVFGEYELARIVELAARYRVAVIADEIHAPLTYDDATHTPFLRVSERAGFDDAVALWAASKAWNLAGLKCATIVAGSAAMLHKLRALPGASAGHLGVLASTAAYERGGPWLRALLAHLARNRALLGERLAAELPAVGYEPPQAGYLAWLDCEPLSRSLDKLGMTKAEPFDVFLARGRVAFSRGSDFGSEGRACVRLNFATTTAILVELVARMRRSLS